MPSRPIPRMLCGLWWVLVVAILVPVGSVKAEGRRSGGYPPSSGLADKIQYLVERASRELSNRREAENRNPERYTEVRKAYEELIKISREFDSLPRIRSDPDLLVAANSADHRFREALARADSTGPRFRMNGPPTQQFWDQSATGPVPPLQAAGPRIEPAHAVSPTIERLKNKVAAATGDFKAYHAVKEKYDQAGISPLDRADIYKKLDEYRQDTEWFENNLERGSNSWTEQSAENVLATFDDYWAQARNFRSDLPKMIQEAVTLRETNIQHEKKKAAEQAQATAASQKAKGTAVAKKAAVEDHADLDQAPTAVAPAEVLPASSSGIFKNPFFHLAAFGLCAAAVAIFVALRERLQADEVRVARLELLRALDSITLYADVAGGEPSTSPQETNLEPLGYSRAGKPMNSMLELVHPGSREKFQAAMDAARGKKELSQVGTFDWLHGSGLVVSCPAEVRVARQRKQPPRMVVSLIGFSSRLEGTGFKGYLHAILNGFDNIGVVLEDGRGRIKTCNSIFRQMFSIKEDPAALQGKELVTVVSPAQKPLSDRDYYNKVVTGASPKNAELKLADGRAMYRRYLPVEQGGSKTGAVWMFQDLTDERRELARQLSRFDAAMPDSDFGTFILDPQGAFLSVSRAATELFGLPADELVGKSESSLLVTPNGTSQRERAYRGPSGETRWAKVRKIEVKNEQGSTQFQLCLFNDITDKKAPKVAQWEDKPADPALWCPPELTQHLWYATDYEYLDVVLANEPGPGDWRIVAIGARGRSHAHVGSYREDAFQIYTDRERCAVMCVSDGAGSAKMSRIASETLCRYVSNDLGARIHTHADEWAGLEEDALQQELGRLIQESCREGFETLRGIAAAGSYTIRDFYCTFLLAVLFESDHGTTILTLQVGDGFVATEHLDGSAKRWGEGDSGEYSGQVSCFAPDDKAYTKLERPMVVAAETVTGLLLGSDGIEDPFFPIETTAGTICNQLRYGVPTSLEHFKQLPSNPVIGPDGDAEEFRKWIQFEKRGENDDRTLLVLWRPR